MPSPPEQRPEPDNQQSRRILLRVAYDGTGFAGWQIQPDTRTVQGTLQEALQEMEGGPVKVRGAGRTDAGVHALDQAASFGTTSTIPCEGYKRGLNGLLPPDASVRTVSEVPLDFDPRFWKCVKVYRYAIHNQDTRDPFLGRYSWHIRTPLDPESMQKAARALEGTHDFSAFRAADCERRDPVRTVDRLDVWNDGRAIFIEVEGPAFLKYMVRVIAGTLVEVGRGKTAADRVAEILRSADRSQAGPTAPACGLTLARATYPELKSIEADSDRPGTSAAVSELLSALPPHQPGTQPWPSERK